MSTPPGALVGERLRRIREGAGLTQDEVAGAAARRGLTTWRRITVGDLESGKRRLTIEEFAALPVILDDLGCRTLRSRGPRLVEADDEVEMAPGWVVSGEIFMRLTGHRRGLPLAEDLQGATPEDEPTAEELATSMAILEGGMRVPDTAETTAAKSLRRSLGQPRLDPVDVQNAAARLWGRRLAEERDARLPDRKGRTPREKQAARGHVTRRLLEELRTDLASRGRASGRGGKGR